MKVDVRLYAALASRLPENRTGNTCAMEIRSGMSVRDVLLELKIAENEPKIMFVNGVHAKLDDVLKDGDRLAVFPPIAGG